VYDETTTLLLVTSRQYSATAVMARRSLQQAVLDAARRRSRRFQLSYMQLRADPTATDSLILVFCTADV